MKTADTVVMTIHCPAESSDYLAELLWTLSGIHGVEEVYSGALHEQSVCAVRIFLDYADSPESPNLGESELEERVNELLQSHELLRSCSIEERKVVSKEDWAESWKKFWHVTHISSQLVICPTWESYNSKSDEIVIQLDPGSAFGTGSHETTCLMLRGMEALAKGKSFDERSILDLGCGSGVLSVYAALLGCSDIIALDIEAEAIQMTRDNAELNRVSHCIDVRDTSLIDMCQTKYDLILANIVAPVLLELMDDIVLRMAPDGDILFSGLVESSVGSIEEAMENAGFEDIERLQDGDWFLLKGRYSG